MRELMLDDYGGVETIADVIVNYFGDPRHDFKTIVFVGKYNDARKILSVFMRRFNTRLMDIELYEDELFNYYDEYLIVLDEFCGVIDVYCEPLKDRSGGYKLIDSDISFVMEDCNSKLLSNLACPDEFIFICEHRNG